MVVEKTNNIVKMFKMGVPLDEIALRMNIGMPAVKYHLRKYRNAKFDGVNFVCVGCNRDDFLSTESLAGHIGYCIPWKKQRNLRNFNTKIENENLVVEMYSSGKNGYDISNETGIKVGTVYNILWRNRGKPERKRRAVALLGEIEISDKKWIAAAIDGEGCLSISSNKKGQFIGSIHVTNYNDDFLSECKKIAKGNIYTHQWQISSLNHIGALLKQIAKYLIVKRRQSIILLLLYDDIFDRNLLKLAIQDLNSGDGKSASTASVLNSDEFKKYWSHYYGQQ